MADPECVAASPRQTARSNSGESRFTASSRGSRAGGSRNNRSLNRLFQQDRKKTVPLPDYQTRVRRWAYFADTDQIRELRLAAKRNQLNLAPHLDAEAILLELCVMMLQRMFRQRLTLYKTFGNLLFARSVQADPSAADFGQPRAADYGTIAWTSEVEDSPYLVCSEATSPKLLANFLRYGPWQIRRPNLLITIVGGARDFELQPPQLVGLHVEDTN